MDIIEAIKSRHSVRNYSDKQIDADIAAALNAEIAECNKISGLKIRLVTDEPQAFKSFLARYGKFSNVSNYIALIGNKDDSDFDEKVGYYGEQIVLKAQQLGLNTCWVAATFSKKHAKNHCGIKDGEKLAMVISVGYGATQGVPHKSKPLESLCGVDGETPDWFKRGMDAALLAPTAMNQQKFFFMLSGNTVKAEKKSGFYSKVDLGIVKYHFEVAAGKENFTWANK